MRTDHHAPNLAGWGRSPRWADLDDLAAGIGSLSALDERGQPVEPMLVVRMDGPVPAPAVLETAVRALADRDGIVVGVALDDAPPVEGSTRHGTVRVTDLSLAAQIHDFRTAAGGDACA